MIRRIASFFNSIFVDVAYDLYAYVPSLTQHAQMPFSVPLSVPLVRVGEMLNRFFTKTIGVPMTDEQLQYVLYKLLPQGVMMMMIKLMK